jgi:hypothetical protein
MREPQYQLEFSKAFTIYEFVSIGPKGEIPKLIKYTETGTPNVYNLGFGDKIGNTEEIDDEVISNNQDSIRVLATVAASVYVFTDNYPNSFIFATGSTPSRTRLYQIGIANNLKEIEEGFYVWGEYDEKWEAFQKNKNYTAFLVTRK